MGSAVASLAVECESLPVPIAPWDTLVSPRITYPVNCRPGILLTKSFKEAAL